VFERHARPGILKGTEITGAIVADLRGQDYIVVARSGHLEQPQGRARPSDAVAALGVTAKGVLVRTCFVTEAVETVVGP
jgi:hypothetical protein